MTAFAIPCAKRVNLAPTLCSVPLTADRQTIFSGSRTVDQKRQFTYSATALDGAQRHPERALRQVSGMQVKWTTQLLRHGTWCCTD